MNNAIGMASAIRSVNSHIDGSNLGPLNSMNWNLIPTSPYADLRHRSVGNNIPMANPTRVDMMIHGNALL